MVDDSWYDNNILVGKAKLMFVVITCIYTCMYMYSVHNYHHVYRTLSLSGC